MNSFLKIHQFLLPQDQDIGFSAYVILGFLAIFYVNFYFRPVSGIEFWAVIAASIVFLICYFRAFWFQGKELLFYIIMISSIGMIMANISWGASVFFVYAAAFCCGFKQQKNAFLALGLVISIIVVFVLVSRISEFFWVPAILFSSIIGLLNIHQTDVHNKNKVLKQSQQEIKLLAQTAERERISRDLHDLLGHSLSVITLKSELAGKMIEKGLPLEKIKQEIKAVEDLSRETLAQVRGAVKGYNNATIEGELLQASVATEAAGIQLITRVEKFEFSPEQESEVALIIRESITNVIRHADTSKLWVDLQVDATDLRLTISDQGQINSLHENSGMQNMRTRINKLGGQMKIIKEPNTQFQFIIPLNVQLNTMR